MANNNFVIQNGLTIGPLTIDAATGSITTTGNIASSGSSGGNLTVSNFNAGVSGNIGVSGNVIPSANITYALGSRTMMWKDVFVGPGTLYINGTPVLGASTTGTPTINMTASAAQDITIATNGGGSLNLDGGSAGGGYIKLKSGIQFIAGQNVTSSDGNAIQFAAALASDSITSHSNNTNLALSAQGIGKIALNSDTVITGNLTVNGQTEIINTTVLNVTTQYATLNSGVIGTPTLDAGLRVNRGTSNNAVLKWSESTQAWQISSDNTTFGNIATQTFVTGQFPTTTAGIYGSATAIPVVTVNSKGLITGVTTSAVSIPSGSLTFTGDVTGTGNTGSSTALTLATSGVSAGSYGSSTAVPIITVDAKGRVTSVSTASVTGGVSSVSGSNHLSVNTSTGAVTVTSDATSANTAGTIVARDGSGNFSAGTVSATATSAQYADLAENYQGDKTYAPGTVVMFGGAQEVTVADADTRAVAGVVSTNPAHLMNGGLNGANVVAVALTGRVPCMVIGPVKKGDMLVSAGHGYAKSSANPQMGQVIGKALYDFPGSSKAVIEVVVGRL
jgi:hypothetical protein